MAEVFKAHGINFSLPRFRGKKSVKRKNYALLSGFFIVCLCFLIYFVSQFGSVQRKYIYPYPYQNEISFYSKHYGLDSNFVLAVIKAESNFKKDATSRRGAMGLMQLMPSTAAWIGEQLGDKDCTLAEFYEPERNIRYGTWYLAELREEFHGNTVLMLAAYNAGRGNVREWMHLYNWNMDFKEVDAIPYEETREYVKKVIANNEKYKKLYK